MLIETASTIQTNMALTTNPLELLLNITRPNQPKPSASMDPVVGYSHWYWPHSKKNRWGNSSPPNQGFFHTTRKQQKNNTKFNFNYKITHPFFHGPTWTHINPHRPEGQNFVPTIWAPQWKCVVALDTLAIYSEADMAMQSKTNAGLLVLQGQAGRRCGK